MEIRGIAEIIGIAVGVSTIAALVYRSGAHSRKSNEIEERLVEVERTYLTEEKHTLLSRLWRGEIDMSINHCQLELKSEVASLRKDNNALSTGLAELKADVREISKGLGIVNESIVKLTTTLEMNKRSSGGSSQNYDEAGASK